MPSIVAGGTQQFVATGTYSDGSTQVITNAVTWSSSSVSVATVSNAAGTQGVASALSPGTAIITATSGSITGSTGLTVTSVIAPTLTSIAVSPVSPTISQLATEQFTATGTYSDGSTQNITASVTWQSSNTNVATISNAAGTQGIATAATPGTTTIIASLGPIGGETTLTVTAATLQSIAVTPLSQTISQLATQQFTATGTYSDGTTQNLTTSVTWKSSNTSVATISNAAGSQGIATAANPGTATITATSGSVSGTATLTVTPATLQSIAVTPLSQTIAQGSTLQFTATGSYSDGTTQNLTTSVTWTSSSTGVATISNSAGSQGLAAGVGSGTTTITAASGSVSGTASLTVTAPTLVSIAVTPQLPSILVGKTQQFTATGTYSDSSTQNITDSVSWSSATTSVATISNSSGSQGLATGVAAGTSTISAALAGVTGSTTLTVSPSVSSQSWSLYGPVARQSHTAVYDPTSQQMIIFGGIDELTGADLNDVWLGVTQTNENDAFTAESPSGTAPQARYGHAATYDSVSNRMTIFGGGTGSPATCLSDTWILTGANGTSGTPAWIALSPATTPQPRLYSAYAYDPNTNSMMVFGGTNCSGSYFNDVWVLSDANDESGTPNWTKLTTTGGPPAARESASAIYDSTNNILTIYGGDAGGSPFGDVWVLSNANGTGGTPAWTQLSPTGTAPMTRTGQTAVYDSANDRMIICGGINAGITLSDTWVLTSANGIGAAPAWTEIVTTSTAPSLAYHSAVYDASSNNMYVFAGLSSEDKLEVNDHAFTLTEANGIPSGPEWVLGGPPVRYGQSAFYDSSTNGLFVFGGEHALSAINFNDYWELAPVIGSTNLQWTALSPGGSRPSGRWGQTGLYDSTSNRLMIFGGATGFPAPCVNDYYILENANTVGGSLTWLAVSTATAPPIRTLQASAYDSATNTIMIFGGYDCTSTYYNDVWILSNANAVSGSPAWTELTPSGTPPSQRESASAIYDPATNSLVIYGGDAGAEPFGDIWILSNANGTGGTPSWTQLTPTANGPGARSGHTATYDATNNIMMIYGGYDGTNILGDTWVLSNANGQGGSAVWTQTLTGQPRRFHSSEYDPNSNQMITYGGTTGVTTQAPTSDVYTLTDANDLP